MQICTLQPRNHHTLIINQHSQNHFLQLSAEVIWCAQDVHRLVTAGKRFLNDHILLKKFIAAHMRGYAEARVFPDF